MQILFETGFESIKNDIKSFNTCQGPELFEFQGQNLGFVILKAPIGAVNQGKGYYFVTLNIYCDKITLLSFNFDQARSSRV